MKQLTTDVQPPFGPFDIGNLDLTTGAQFSSDFEWYFRSENTTISSEQYDLEMVAAHEITHGLGFSSNLLEYRLVFGATAKTDYLAPLPINLSNGYIIPY